MGEFERAIMDRLREKMPTHPALWCCICGANLYGWDDPHECNPRPQDFRGILGD